MRLKGNILTALLLLMMTVILSAGISASEQVCYIGENTETLYTLNEAINTARAGSTIHLIRDAELYETNTSNNRMTISKALTIDGANGEEKFTITFNAEAQIMGASATVTFTNVKLNLNKKRIRTDNAGAKLVFGNGTLVTGGLGDNGGAVQVNNSSELVLEKGSAIENCTATSNGGAIFVNGGTVTVNSGARIENCTSSGGGGAIHVQGTAGKLNLLGGVITGNHASGSGSGIYMYEGTLSVSGDAVVTGNTRTSDSATRNIQLTSADQLTLSGTFTGSAGVFINPATVGTVFGIAGEGASGSENIFYDGNNASTQLYGIIDGTNLVFGKSGVAYIGDNKYNRMTLNEAISTAAPGSTIHLAADAELYETNTSNNRMTISKALTIDGANGEGKFTITFNAEAQIMGRSATVTFTNVKLELNKKRIRTDNAGAKLVFGNGTLVTGGSGVNGGAVQVNNTSELVLEEGSTITDCHADTSNGGAIFVNGGTVTVNSGARIENCTASGGGGAIHVQGTAGKLNLLGGEITGNTSNNGGGIYMYEGALTISGEAVVTGNKKGETNNNIQLRNASQLTLTGTFTGSAGVFINPATVGTVFGIAGEGASGSENIFYDGNNTSTQLYGIIDGTNLVFGKSGVAYIGDDKYNRMTLNDAINTAQAESTIHLIADAEFNEKEGATNNRMTIGKALTIDGANGENKFTIMFNAEAQIMGASATVTFTNVKLNLNSHRFRTDNAGAKLVFGTGTLVTGGLGDNGGAVQVNNTSELVLEEGSTIENCTATSNGGAIFVNGGTVTVNSGARIEKCTASGGGGAIHVQGAAGKLNLLGGEITGNTSNNGGGIYIYEGTLTISGEAVVTGNKKGETNNNIQLRNASQLNISGAFTGNIGVNYINTYGAEIGTVAEDVTTLPTIESVVCDTDSSLFAKVSGGKLVLTKKPTLSVTTDTGVYTKEDGGMKYGVIRVMNTAQSAEEIPVEYCGTVVVSVKPSGNPSIEGENLVKLLNQTFGKDKGYMADVIDIYDKANNAAADSATAYAINFYKYAGIAEVVFDAPVAISYVKSDAKDLGLNPQQLNYQ